MKTYKTTLPKISLRLEKSSIERAKITNSNDVNKFVRNFYFEDIEIFESMFLVLLSRQNVTIGYVKLSQGGTTATIFDVKLLIKYAIEGLASSVILVHNHPSGNNQPSENDKTVTTKAKEALKVFDITLLDHVIVVADGEHYSFADNGII